MGFVRDWQKKLGYRHDPFLAVPSKKVSDYFVDREEEREALNLFIIKQKRFGILHGDEGKSTLAGWLKEQVGDNALILDPKKKKEFSEQLMQHALNFIERTVTKPHEKVKGEQLQALLLKKLARRDLLLIIDDASDLQNDQKWLLKQIIESCPKIQVILVTQKPLKEHADYGVDELNLSLKTMPNDQLSMLLQQRIELTGSRGTWPFDEDEIEKLITKAKSNPKKLLELARDRAIELSLKVQSLPKPVHKQQHSQQSSQDTPKKSTQKEKSSWFKLVRNDEERIAYEQGETQQPVIETPKVQTSDQALNEAAELEAALHAALEETAPKKKEEPKEEPKNSPSLAKHTAKHTTQAHKGPITHGRRRGR